MGDSISGVDLGSRSRRSAFPKTLVYRAVCVPRRTAKLDFVGLPIVSIIPQMNETNDKPSTIPPWRIAQLCGCAVIALWIAQPPLGWWPAIAVAIVPWLHLARDSASWSKRSVLIVWAISSIYFLVSFQGLRHAHALMIFPTLALAGYLAVYHVAFVLIMRRLLGRSEAMILVAPIVWVGLECIRNYLLTGLSALMLAHSMTSVPEAIQIADLFGSYGISFVIVAANVSLESTVRLIRTHGSRRLGLTTTVMGAVLVVSTFAYGVFRLQQPLGDPAATFALIQRSEPIEYVQSDERAIEIFQSYLMESQLAVQSPRRRVDAVVWPESMFTAGLPLMILKPDAEIPANAQLSMDEFQDYVRDGQARFVDRVDYTMDILKRNEFGSAPDLIVGCGVVEYGSVPDVYSGIVHLGGAGDVRQWYGKTHLVMFGEYIPIAPWIPGIRNLIPPGMGLTVGPGPRPMQVKGTTALPLICIETAVERIAVNQLAELRQTDQPIDVLVTVTNDGWFDDSSVVEHHLRCGQIVAVATRRPLLSAANNGPTAWIDSNGRMVQHLQQGTDGSILASPKKDGRDSLYVRIGAWPAWICVMISGLLLVMPSRNSNEDDA